MTHLLQNRTWFRKNQTRHFQRTFQIIANKVEEFLGIRKNARFHVELVNLLNKLINFHRLKSIQI